MFFGSTKQNMEKIINNNMETTELLKYIKTEIQKIKDKYSACNVCNIGPGLMCKNNKPWRIPGHGCCTDCVYHEEKRGCTITNLCCMSFYCLETKDKFEETDWIKLKSTVILLQSLGLEPRETWDEQMIKMEIRTHLLDVETEDIYNLFKTIFNG